MYNRMHVDVEGYTLFGDGITIEWALLSDALILEFLDIFPFGGPWKLSGEFTLSLVPVSGYRKPEDYLASWEKLSEWFKLKNISCEGVIEYLMKDTYGKMLISKNSVSLLEYKKPHATWRDEFGKPSITIISFNKKKL